MKGKKEKKRRKMKGKEKERNFVNRENSEKHGSSSRGGFETGARLKMSTVGIPNFQVKTRNKTLQNWHENGVTLRILQWKVSNAILFSFYDFAQYF